MELEQWEKYIPYAIAAMQKGGYILASEFRFVRTATGFVAHVNVVMGGDRIYKIFLDSLPDELLFLWQLSQ